MSVSIYSYTRRGNMIQIHSYIYLKRYTFHRRNIQSFLCKLFFLRIPSSPFHSPPSSSPFALIPPLPLPLPTPLISPASSNFKWVWRITAHPPYPPLQPPPPAASITGWGDKSGLKGKGRGRGRGWMREEGLKEDTKQEARMRKNLRRVWKSGEAIVCV